MAANGFRIPVLAQPNEAFVALAAGEPVPRARTGVWWLGPRRREMLLSPSLVRAGVLLLLLLAAPLHGREIRFGAKALRVRRGLRGGAEPETGCGPQGEGFDKEMLGNNTHKVRAGSGLPGRTERPGLGH